MTLTGWLIWVSEWVSESIRQSACSQPVGEMVSGLVKISQWISLSFRQYISLSFIQEMDLDDGIAALQKRTTWMIGEDSFKKCDGEI